jgi:hypothetical protein
VMRGSNPYLTPARAGLIMIAVVVLGVIFVRVITMSEQSEVRTDTSPEKDSQVTLGASVKGLRGSLP